MRVGVGVLISGSGTNLQALLDATAAPDHPARIQVVLSNRPSAGGLDRAKAAGVPTQVLRPADYPSRDAYDHALVESLRAHDVRWVCLAGFMRLIGPTLLDAFPQRILNIHPSLLPAFPGLDAQAQALAHGVRIAGATVHLVDEGVDTGAIIDQAAVPVLPDDDVARLSARILQVEHQLYPRALRWAVEGRLQREGRRIRISPPSDGPPLPR